MFVEVRKGSALINSMDLYQLSFERTDIMEMCCFYKLVLNAFNAETIYEIHSSLEI